VVLAFELAERFDRRAAQQPSLAALAEKKAGAGEALQSETDGGAPGADQHAQELVGERQGDEHTVGCDLAEAFGQQPEQHQQSGVGGGKMADDLDQREIARALGGSRGDLAVDDWPPGGAQHELAV
jgi:hypothetical protein